MRQEICLIRDFLPIPRLVWIHEGRTSIRNEQVDGPPSLLGTPLLREPAGRLERSQIQRHDLERSSRVHCAQLVERCLCLVGVAACQYNVTLQRGQV